MNIRPLVTRFDASNLEHLPLRTGDGLDLELTRIARGGNARAAVLLVHGLTSSSEMFVLPETRNFAEVLLDSGYEVWMLDWRGSCRLPYNETGPSYTLDDVALYDIPAAVAMVRSRIGARPLFMVSHCVGSLCTALSLASGLVPGLAGVVGQGVFLTPKMPLISRVLMGTVAEIGRRQTDTMPVDFRRVGLLSRNTPLFVIAALRAKWQARRSGRPECTDPTCQMFNHMGWGIAVSLFVHDNIHPRTHDRLPELLGTSPNWLLPHLRKMELAHTAMRWNEDDARYGALTHNGLDEAHRIDCPILLVRGTENGLWLDSNKLCAEVLAERHPTLDVRYVEVPDYGAFDPFVGQSAAVDVFPWITEWLDEKLATTSSRQAPELTALPSVAEASR